MELFCTRHNISLSMSFDQFRMILILMSYAVILRLSYDLYLRIAQLTCAKF